MRRTFAGEPGRGSRPRPLRECPQALLHEALARALDRNATRRDLLSNFLITEPFISFQQNAGARYLSGGGLARVDQPQKCVSLCRS
jgi:hypothetical protein